MSDEAGAHGDTTFHDREMKRIQTLNPFDTIREALELLHGIDYEEASRVGRAVEKLEAALTEVEQRLNFADAYKYRARAEAAEQRANDAETLLLDALARANELQALADDRLALMRANEKGWRAERDARAALDRQEQR